MNPPRGIRADVLLVTLNFPGTDTVKDGMGSYMTNAVHYLIKETGWNIRAVVFRFSGEEPYEERSGLSIERIDLPFGINHFEEIYRPQNFNIAVSHLAAAASRAASGIGGKIPVWCHGYETGAAARRLSENGCHVVGVVHYLVAQDLFHRLENANDPLRKSYAHGSLSSICSGLCPSGLRPALIRLVSLGTPVLCKMPMPPRFELLHKLEQESRLMNSSRQVVAVSPGFGATIVRYYPGVRNKIKECVAGSPSPVSGSYWPFPIRDDRLRLVMVGRPAPQKGWDYVAEALRRLESSRPDEAVRVELAVIGGLGDWGGDFSSRINKDFLALKKISLANIGEIPNEEVRRIMSAADALLLPSTFEPFGLVMIEAMSSGCIILSSDCDGPRDIVKAPWGILMPFQNPGERVHALETGINQLLSLTRDELRERGEAARKASAGYNWKECVQTHAETLRGGFV